MVQSARSLNRSATSKVRRFGFALFLHTSVAMVIYESTARPWGWGGGGWGEGVEGRIESIEKVPVISWNKKRLFSVENGFLFFYFFGMSNKSSTDG